MTDYAAMSAADMLTECADNGQKWAQAFMQITAKYDHPIDEAGMIGWFANAIEQSHAVRRWALDKHPVMVAAKTYAEAKAAWTAHRGPPQGRDEEKLLCEISDARNNLGLAATEAFPTETSN